MPGAPSAGPVAGGTLPWAPPPAAAPSMEDSMAMDDDDFNVLLDLAAWLSHTSSPAAQQYTLRLYLHIFSLWPQQQGRVRMIQALTHRTASFASICNQSDPNQQLLPVQAGSIESRVLICLMEGWPQYAPVALLCMLDLLGKQSSAYMVQCMQKQMTVGPCLPACLFDRLRLLHTLLCSAGTGVRHLVLRAAEQASREGALF